MSIQVFMRACLSLLVALSLLITTPMPAFAASRGFSAIAVDAHTGKVLVARNADVERYPASITKVMTLYVLFQEMKARRLDKNSRLKVSAKASRQQPSKLGLKPGETVTIDVAIKALVTRSANDVAVVIAENIAGSEKAFAARMTKVAKSLGMTRSRFANASGLPNKAQVTTARDIATLSLRIQRDFPEYYPYFKIKSFVYRGKTIATHNKLLNQFQGTDGIKTGFINASGFNVTTSVARGNKRLIGVVIGAPSGGARNRYMIAMLEPLFKQVPGSSSRNIASLAGKPPGLKSQPVEVAAAAPSATLPETQLAAKPATPAIVVKAVPLPRAKPEVIEAKVEEPEAPEAPQALPEDITDSEDGAEVETATTFTAVIVEEQSPDTDNTLVAIDGDSDMTREDTKALFADGEMVWPVATREHKGDYRVFAPVQTASSAAMPSIAALVEETTPAATVTTAAVDEPEAEVTASTTPAPDSWQVQIGAWKAEADATRRLARAEKLNLPGLGGKDALTVKTDQKGKIVYTARFAGFASQKEARNACLALSKKGFGCLPIAPGQSG
jgi:D-alanyl-D-alanine carboxypeptidase